MRQSLGSAFLIIARPRPFEEFGVDTYVTQRDRLEVQDFDWGTLQWLASAALLPGGSRRSA